MALPIAEKTGAAARDAWYTTFWAIALLATVGALAIWQLHRASQRTTAQNALLAAISRVESMFIAEADARDVFVDYGTTCALDVSGRLECLLLYPGLSSILSCTLHFGDAFEHLLALAPGL